MLGRPFQPDAMLAWPTGRAAIMGPEQAASVLAQVRAQINEREGNGTAGSIGSIYAHIVLSQDNLMSRFLGEPTIYESRGWNEKLGVENPGVFQTPEWSATVKVTKQFDDYANEVFARTEEALGSLTEEDLAKPMEGFGGQPVPALALIANIGLIHVNEHAGEIAALKGVHGLKGLGF